MPEGDTVHKIARALAPALVGHRLAALRLRDRGELAALRGAEVRGVEARGKHLVVTLAPGWTLRVHLGMKGRWRRLPAAAPAAATASAALELVTERERFACFRAGQVELVRGDGRASARLARLGPDLLAAAPDLDEVLRRARGPGQAARATGELLLDQWVAGGIGNVYKSEVLFLAGIHPWTPAGRLDDDRLLEPYRTAARLLRANLDQPGRRVTVPRRGWRTAHPGAVPRLWVYRRRGRPCLRCATRIEMRRQGTQARSTYWCPRCQPVDDATGPASSGSSTGTGRDRRVEPGVGPR